MSEGRGDLRTVLASGVLNECVLAVGVAPAVAPAAAAAAALLGGRCRIVFIKGVLLGLTAADGHVSDGPAADVARITGSTPTARRASVNAAAFLRRTPCAASYWSLS